MIPASVVVLLVAAVAALAVVNMLGRSKRSAGSVVGPRSSTHTRSAVLAPKGEVTTQGVGVLRDAIENVRTRGPSKIVLDLSNVNALDPDAVRAIVECYHHFSDSNFSVVAPPGSAAAQAFESLGPGQAIPIEPALPFAQPLRDSIAKAESQAPTSDPAATSDPTTASDPSAPSDPDTWKGF